MLTVLSKLDVYMHIYMFMVTVAYYLENVNY